jgi:hypothetical protein
VIFTLGQIESIVSELPPFDRMGHSPEGQSAVWVPVARVQPGGEHLVAEELLMFTPYMWVDNPISLPSGREMYGFSKAFGWMELGEEALGLDVFGMDYGKNEAPSRRPLVRVKRGERVHELADLAWSALVDIGRHFRHLVERGPGEAVHPGLKLAETLAKDVKAGGLRQAFLRQVRSIEDGAQAALQQVTEARYHVLSVRGVPLEHEYDVTIEALDSHPLGHELGLASQTTRYAFRTESEFLLEPGRVVWPA